MSDDAFALENFAPPEFTRFRLSKHGDQEFRIDGDPDTGDVALMLRIEEKLRGSENESEAVAASIEGKDLLVRLIREHDPDIEDLKIGMQEVLVIFSLIIRGSSMAEAVAKAITPNTTADAALEPGDETERKPDDESEGGASVTPLPSPKPSSGPSSISADETDGLPATGTA